MARSRLGSGTGDAVADSAGSRGATDAIASGATGSRSGFDGLRTTPSTTPSTRSPKSVEETEIATNARALQKAPTSEVSAKAAQPNVQKAANDNASKLAKLGLKGALGVAALMVLTGESNPVTAIQKALEAAEEVVDTATDAGAGLLGLIQQLIDFFTNYGLFVCLSSSMCLFLVMVLMFMK